MLPANLVPSSWHHYRDIANALFATLGESRMGNQQWKKILIGTFFFF